MIRIVAIAFAVSLAACPRAPNVVPLSDQCSEACAHAESLGCPQPDDCADSFSKWDQGPAFVRRPDTGRALRCVDVASAQSKDDLLGMGLECP
jgi:hypothetical protein